MNHPAVSMLVQIYDRQQLVFSTPLDSALTVGRQKRGEPAPICRLQGPNGDRLIIASRGDATVSRSQALLKPGSEGRISITNLSRVRKIAMDSENLAPDNTTQTAVPVALDFGHLRVWIENLSMQAAELEGLAHQTLLPGQHVRSEGSLHDLVSNRIGALDAHQLLSWMQTAMAVFQSATTSVDFLDKAAAAAAELIDLDHAVVVLWESGDWKIAASTSRVGMELSSEWRPSQSILGRMQAEKRTFRNLPPRNTSAAVSLADIAALVSAPILDRHGQVIGALYGDRLCAQAKERPREITIAEATLVDLLASSLAAGLARIEQEQAALAARVQFEQFFTPALAHRLEAQPDLLSGRDMDVTILFCDISGFSRISQRLGPARTVAWVSDVMAALSDCVIEHAGVLVDYIGDELMAMWGAPVEQADHARLACAAAVDMMRCLPQLNEKWQPVLGEPVVMGIGIDSGLAHVGNTGSPRKFKYGPLGNTVNIASRVQGATRHLKSHVLITGSTAERLSNEFPIRRLCQVRVVNIDEPVTLYELPTDVSDEWQAFKEKYEQALSAFEARDLRGATRILGALAADHPNDYPTLLLLSRAVEPHTSSGESFDPVWKLPGK